MTFRASESACPRSWFPITAYVPQGGVEITLEYLANQMPYRELSANQKGAYLLGLREGQGNEVLAMGESGPLFRRILADDRKVAITEEKGIPE